MTAIELTGPIPRSRRAISSRFVILGLVLAILGVLSIIWGFYKRIQQKELRDQSQHTAAVASDAAAPPQDLRGAVPVSSVTGTQPSATVPAASAMTQPNTAAPLPGVTPVANAIGTIAHPFPASQPAPQPAPIYYQPMPAPEPQRDPRQTALDRSIARAQQAEEASTGATQQQSAAPVDPVSSEMARLNALLSPASIGMGNNPVVPTPTHPQQTGGGLPVAGDANAQDQKETFQGPTFRQGQASTDGYLHAIRVPPLGRFVLQRGAVIPAALPQKVVSDLPGDLVAEVERDVYDSPTQTFVLIPAGSRLVGQYNSHLTYGQQRVQIVWNAIYFPDGSFVDLDKMPAQAADGGAGLHDQVDSHLKRLIGGVALSSMLAAGLQISQNRTSGSVLTYPSNGQLAASAVGTQAAELGQQITNRNLNVQPTLKIRPGEIFGVFVTRDILFPAPYEAIR
jgi:type IV secretory pathway VirB10-like protein